MADNKWSQPDAPPPPLFTGEKERNLVKQINDEVIERVIGQTVLYYPISLDKTSFHSLYGEAINKTFLPPVRVYALIGWEGQESTNTSLGVDKRSNINFVREGDFILYGKFHYEIVTLNEPRELFGQVEYKYEIAATCKRARKGTFNAL